jgi:general stress protein 26
MMEETVNKCIRYASAIPTLYLAILLLWPAGILAQDSQSPNDNRDILIKAAREIMTATRYCALITLDETGHPQARIMDPFTPEDDMIVWFGTNANSRKVREIKNDSRATLYYEAPDGVGYVVMKGHAYLVDDADKKLKYWKKEWDSFYSDKESRYILIQVIPDKLEIVDYRHGLTGESKTWAVPYVDFHSARCYPTSSSRPAPSPSAGGGTNTSPRATGA